MGPVPPPAARRCHAPAENQPQLRDGRSTNSLQPFLTAPRGAMAGSAGSWQGSHGAAWKLAGRQSGGSARSQGLAEPSALRGQQLLPAGGTREPALARKSIPSTTRTTRSLKHPPRTPKLCSRRGLYGFQHREQSSSAHSPGSQMPPLGGNAPFTLLANSNFNQLKINFVLLTKLPRMTSDIF